MAKSEFSIEEQQMIQTEFEALLADYAQTRHRQKREIITRAFEFAQNAHYGVRRLSGEPYIMHPLAVARIVVKEIGLGSTSICSALLHDVVEDTDYTTEDIERLFGPKIAQIVDGLTKISGGVFGDKASAQAENFRKLLLTMSDDIRVVLIKIADRLHNMRTLTSQPKEKQYKIAGETQYIYAPLAHRLGFFPIKSELENLSFKYEHPETYAELENKLANIREDLMAKYEKFSEPIKQKLTEMGYTFSISARLKTVYSVWKKMITKHVPFEGVYDLMAVRIIFTPLPSLPEKEQCWMIYAAITAFYHPHPERIRDWISTPKANGYEALHVTVMADDGQWVEVQIRTDRMHELAEKGLAAHWKYKNDETSEKESELDKWLNNIKEILAHPEQDAMDFLDNFKLNLYAHEVFVFTPSGEIKTLPLGATALDLAYMLHTNLGERAIGAKVNHTLQPISYVLKSGDQVEILASDSTHPMPEWENWVTTAKAKAKLQEYFKREERSLITIGEQTLLDILGNYSWGDNKDAVVQKLMNHYQLSQPQELYLGIGRGTYPLDNIQTILFPKKSVWNRLNPFSSSSSKSLEQESKETRRQTEGNSNKWKKKTILLTDENIGKEFKLAPCCHPIPGDEVMGYIASDDVVLIHKLDCAEAQHIKTSQGARICAAQWDTHRVQSFVETIEIQGIDKFGVLINVLTIITTEFHINIHNISMKSDNGIFTGQLEIYIYDKRELQDLFKALMAIPEIQSAIRVEYPQRNK